MPTSTMLKESLNAVMEVEQATIGEVDIVPCKSKWSIHTWIYGIRLSKSLFSSEREGINEIGESIMNMIRSEVEICDKFDGFTLCHSIAGGTGSGLGSWILEQFPDFLYVSVV